ncbi:MAG: hypothetical protein JRC68_06140 [Deltaproteobacteria bacterium]|nr:hypothetical protein [Deltaproteobacteria bacterium]
MDTYARVDKPGPISPGSGGVWKIQKKRKTGDRQRQNEKKEQRSKKEEEAQDTASGQGLKKESIVVNHETEEQAGYGSAKPKKRISKKIDLTI